MMIFKLRDMIGFKSCQSQLPTGEWVRAVPMHYENNIFEKLQAAWAILKGDAEAVVWPEHGDLEKALKQ